MYNHTNTEEDRETKMKLKNTNGKKANLSSGKELQ